MLVEAELSWISRTAGLREHRLQGRPEWIGAGVALGLGQSRRIGGIPEGGRIAGVGEGITHAPQGVEGSQHRGLDQAKPCGQAAPRPEGSQGPIGLEDLVRGARSR